MNTKLANFLITLSCLSGLGLSIYAYFVETAAEQNKDYVAMCDINEHMSCTKVFKSEYARGFGIVKNLLGEDSVFNKPNSLLGMAFYSVLACFAQVNSKAVTKGAIFAVLLSDLSSIYFALILLFVLKDICVVCVGTYVVNFVNLYLFLKKLTSLSVKTVRKKQKSN